MTQLELAEKMGVTDKAVSKWENGTSDPSTSNQVGYETGNGLAAKEIYPIQILIPFLN